MFVILPTIVASIFTFVPIENLLSTYPVPKSFVWYIAWRGAVVALILWILSGTLYSEKRYWLKEFFLGSAVAFIIFHYWHLYVVSQFLRIQIYPLVYFSGNSPPIADLGQIVLIFTIIAFRKEIASSFRRQST